MSETPLPSASLEPPFDVAHKMQRLALDLAWRAYAHDTEHREQLATWLREHGSAVWRLQADALAAQREALHQLRDALKFYAQLEMAELHSGDREPGTLVKDLGAKARAALSAFPDGERGASRTTPSLPRVQRGSGEDR